MNITIASIAQQLVNPSYSLGVSALVSHSLLIISYIEPPVIDSDAIVKPSIVISGGFIMPRHFYPPLVESRVYVMPKGIQLSATLSAQNGYPAKMICRIIDS